MSGPLPSVIPASAGMTGFALGLWRFGTGCEMSGSLPSVIPAKAGIHEPTRPGWTPASAGMTGKEGP
jgi:hypothetical protein